MTRRANAPALVTLDGIHASTGYISPHGSIHPAKVGDTWRLLHHHPEGDTLTATTYRTPRSARSAARDAAMTAWTHWAYR